MTTVHFSGTFNFKHIDKLQLQKALTIINDERKAYNQVLEEKAVLSLKQHFPVRSVVWPKRLTEDCFEVETFRPTSYDHSAPYDYGTERLTRDIESAPELDNRIKDALDRERVQYQYQSDSITSIDGSGVIRFCKSKKPINLDVFLKTL